MDIIDVLKRSRRALAARDHLAQVCRITGTNFEEKEERARQLFHERPYTEEQAYDRVKDQTWQEWVER